MLTLYHSPERIAGHSIVCAEMGVVVPRRIGYNIFMYPDILDYYLLEVFEVVALSPDEVRAFGQTGRIVDVRPTMAFLHRHVAGSLNLPYQSSWPADVVRRVPNSEPVVVVGPSARMAEMAADQLRNYGISVAGYLNAPFTLLEGIDGIKWAQATVIPAADLPAWTRREDAVLVDVRLPEDTARGFIPGARHIPLPEVEAADLDPARPVVLYCGTGGKAVTAAARLLERGFEKVHVVAAGGMEDWYQNQWPTVPSDG